MNRMNKPKATEESAGMILSMKKSFFCSQRDLKIHLEMYFSKYISDLTEICSDLIKEFVNIDKYQQ